MKKRIFASALALALCLGLAPMASAAEPQVIWLDYDTVSDFSEGLAAVGKSESGNINDCLYGFVDKAGKVVIPLQYDYATEFSEGLAQVKTGKYDNAKYGFIDKTGKTVIPFQFTGAGDFSEGLAPVEQGGKWGYIDKTGRLVIAYQFSYAGEFSNGVAIVKKGDSHFYIDGTGNEVAFNAYGEFKLTKVGSGINTKYGLQDANGNEVVAPKYGYIDSFSGGYAMVSTLRSDWGPSGDFGFIDQKGNEIVPLRYDGAHEFSEGLAMVETIVQVGYNNTVTLCGYIDGSGREVIPCAAGRAYARDFHEGLAAVCQNGEWGYLDKTGKMVVPAMFYGAEDFHEGIAVVFNRNNGTDRYGLLFNPLTGGTPTPSPTVPAQLAYPSTQEVEVDGKKVTFQCYALKDANGNDTNYIELRDLADILNGSAAQFQVGWDGNITITTGKAYTKNGTEQNTPFSGNRQYEKTGVTTLVNGAAAQLDTFQLKDDNGGGYTYYKLRDLGAALGITVDWSAERGIYIETE